MSLSWSVFTTATRVRLAPDTYNYPEITLWLTPAGRELAAIDHDHVVNTHKVTPAEEDEILSCPAEKVLDDIMHGTDLARTIAVDYLGQTP
ncbi:MAG: hypothetical protein EP328_00700, partial [Gammaproteobacteria bacterium]